MAEAIPGASAELRPPKRERIRPEINVTPLVDVVLVLLIIFMVVMPELEKGGRVTLPNVLNPDPDSKKKEEGITVIVAADDQIWVDGSVVPRADVLELLKRLHKESPDKRLYLKGDDGRPYGEMRDLFRDLQKVGFAGVRLLVSAPQTTGPAPEEGR